MLISLMKPLFSQGLACAIAVFGLALFSLTWPWGQDRQFAAAAQTTDETSPEEKAIKELLTLLLEQDSFAPQRLGNLVKQPVVAAIMVDLYRDHATRAEPDCRDLFDVDKGYTIATIAMEPYGKINSTGFDPTTNGARPITNREVKDEKLKRVLERIQDVMGEFHPEPTKSPRIPGLTFEFQGALNDGPANLKHAQFICLIKPE